MKKIIFGLLILLSSVAYGQRETTYQEVLNLSKKKFEWMTKVQPDSLATVLDDSLKYVHSNGWVQTKQDVLADFKSGKLVCSSITVDDANVRFFDSTAILIGKGAFAGSINGTAFDLHLQYTEVYVKKKGHWWLASRHANKMP